MFSDEWFLLEEYIKKNLIESLNYEGINLWSMMRRRLFHYTLREFNPRFPKLRMNICFNRLIYFLFNIILMSIFKILTIGHTQKLGDRVILITTRDIDWGKIRDLKTGKIKEGEILYDSIIQELKRRNYNPVLVYKFAETPHGFIKVIKKLLPRLRFQILVPLSFWSIKTWVKSYIWTKYFVRNVWEKGRFILNEKTSQNVLKEFEVCYKMYIQTIIENIEISKSVILKTNPKVMIGWDFKGVGLAISNVARKFGISTMNYEFIGASDSRSDILINRDIVGLPDMFIVGLKTRYDYLLSRGIEKERLKFIGSPHRDIIGIAKKIYSKENFCEKLGLNPEYKLVLISTSCIPPSHRFALKIAKIFQDIPETNVVFTHHPGETEREYEELLKGFNVKVLDYSIELYEQLSVPDLMIGERSTILTEAVLFGTPVMTVNFSNPDKAPYLNEYTLRINEEEMEDIIPKAIHDPKIQEIIKQKNKNICSMENGHATERFVDIICELVEK